MTPKSERRRPRGFSLIEILVVVVIIGILSVIVMPRAGKMIRKARALSAISSMNRVLTQARLNAVKRGFPVVAQFSWNTKSGRIHIQSFEDRSGDFQLGTYTDPSGATQNEVVLGEWDDEKTFTYLVQGQPLNTDPATNLTTAVKFNKYNSLATNQALIAFLPTGGIVMPQGDGSPSDPPTLTGGRGIYIGDERGYNYFRLTIYNPLVGKVKVEKYVDAVPSMSITAGYQDNNWVWK